MPPRTDHLNDERVEYFPTGSHLPLDTNPSAIPAPLGFPMWASWGARALKKGLGKTTERQMQVLAARSCQEEKSLSFHSLSTTAVVKIRRQLSKCNMGTKGLCFRWGQQSMKHVLYNSLSLNEEFSFFPCGLKTIVIPNIYITCSYIFRCPNFPTRQLLPLFFKVKIKERKINMSYGATNVAIRDKKDKNN